LTGLHESVYVYYSISILTLLGWLQRVLAMPPAWNSPSGEDATPATPLLPRNEEQAVSVASYLATQWDNPSDILSILLLLGPDIVQRAIAQLAGRVITPVAFSLGWVSYAASAVLSSVGGKKETYISAV
jgi:hypothetical protein